MCSSDLETLPPQSDPTMRAITVSHARIVTGMAHETLTRFAMQCRRWVWVNDSLRAFDAGELSDAIASDLSIPIRKSRREIAAKCLRRWANRGVA